MPQKGRQPVYEALTRSLSSMGVTEYACSRAIRAALLICTILHSSPALP